MTSPENLGPQFDGPLFHGTPEEFKPGDVILPATGAGKDASANPDIAYATPSLYTAKFMAWERNNHTGDNRREDREENPPVENVYRVEPADTSEQLNVEGGLIIDPTQTTGKTGRYADKIHGFSEEVTSKKGFRVLSKLFDPARTISLKRRLANMEITRGNLIENEGWLHRNLDLDVRKPAGMTSAERNSQIDEHAKYVKKLVDKTPMKD